MSLVVFVHVKHEHPAELGSILQKQGHRLRQVNLYAGDPVPPDLDDVDGVISMGGPMNVDEADQHPWMEHELAYLKAAHEAGVPIVGVCLGSQLLAAALGGEVAAMEKPEIGWAPLKLAFPGTTDSMYAGMGWQSVQFHIHGQEVTKLPPDAVGLAGSAACKNQAFRVGLTTYAFQYHFEWNRADLEVMMADPFITKSGFSPEEILQQAQAYYDDYRRLGDRLCHAIATQLFPLDKR